MGAAPSIRILRAGKAHLLTPLLLTIPCGKEPPGRGKGKLVWRPHATAKSVFEAEVELPVPEQSGGPWATTNISWSQVRFKHKQAEPKPTLQFCVFSVLCVCVLYCVLLCCVLFCSVVCGVCVCGFVCVSRFLSLSLSLCDCVSVRVCVSAFVFVCV